MIRGSAKFWSACLWLVAFAGAPSGAFADEGCQLGVNKVRYQDDIACFRDPANRDTALDALNVIPFDAGGDRFISLGGEVRQRYEYTHNPGFGADPQDRAGVWLQRHVLHGDLRLGPHLRAFGQLSSAFATGRRGGPSPVDENRLALQNAFLDLGAAVGPESWLTLRGGRQELQFGSGRLVDVREGPNVRRSFDAGRVTLDFPGWQVDGVAARPRAAERGVLDDEADLGQALWGLYATGGRALLPAGALDVYYLGFDDDDGTYQQGRGDERRHSVGARFWGEEAGWSWNWEAIYQFGTFGAGDISAWTLATDTSYTLDDLPWQPRITFNANIASGDGDPDDPDLGTFNPLFPRGNYFSEAAVLGPRNFFNVHPYVTVSPAPGWSLTSDVNVFWRLETEDGVYAPSGQLLRAAGGSDERYVGSAVSLTSEYALTERLSLTAIYTHFFPGDFIEATGPSDAIDFVELTVLFRF